MVGMRKEQQNRNSTLKAFDFNEEELIGLKNHFQQLNELFEKVLE